MQTNSLATKTKGAANRPQLKKSAQDFVALGFPVLALDKHKRPATGENWNHLKTRLTNANEIDKWFSNSEAVGLAIVAGRISGNLELIDVDVKFDQTKQLWTKYRDLIIEYDPELYKKLVIAETVNGGVHLLFRHKGATVKTNHHLAKRPTTEAERQAEKARKGSFSKFHPLIETRGEGGYFAVSPTQGYRFIQGDLSSVQVLTDDERLLLYVLAKTFDQMPIEQDYKEKRVNQEFSANGLSPFEDYNQKADIPALLQNHGWKIVSDRGNIIQLKRPGHTDSKSSASFFKDRRIFYVFSSSTEFESEKGYSPVGVYTILEHNGDYSATSKALYDAGYGERREAKKSGASQNQSVVINEPTPLPTKKQIVTPELNTALLPESWKEWLEDISERLQCPLDYATVSAIVGAASLIGNRIRIKPKKYDSWLVVCNLWGGIVGAPGVLKTPAVNEGLLFFREIAEKQRLVFEESQRTAEFEKDFNDAKRATLKKEMAKAKAGQKENFKQKFLELQTDTPIEKRLWTTDVTVEKLGELLNENPEGLLILRDELTGWFRTLERAGHEQDRAFYLEAWNGEGSFTFDRIGRGKTHIKNLTVSILGTIQPAMIEPYLRGSLEGYGDDGLIQRFQMMTYPETPKNYKYIDRAPKGRDKARTSFKKLFDLKLEDIGAKFLTEDSGGHAFLQFDNEAQDFFQGWLTDLENDLRSDTFDTSSLRSHLSKYRSLMPTLSLIFHLLDRISGENGNNFVSLKYAKMAAAWCSYLQAHAEKLYGMVCLSDVDYAHAILDKIKGKQLSNGFTARDIYGKHWKGLSKPEDVKSGLEVLIEYGYLSTAQINEGHRPKIIHRFNEVLK